MRQPSTQLRRVILAGLSECLGLHSGALHTRSTKNQVMKIQNVMRQRYAAQFVLSMAVGVSVLAHAPSMAAVGMDATQKACKLGRDPNPPGDENYPGGLSRVGSALTPQNLPGATTVSAREAKCMLDKIGQDVLVLAVVNDMETLPGAHKIPWAGSGSDSPDMQQNFEERLLALANGDKTKPLLVYCHHVRCFLSYNAALRAVNAGFSNVHWLRAGSQGWASAGYAFVEDPAAKALAASSLEEAGACAEKAIRFAPADFTYLVAQSENRLDLDKRFQQAMEERQKQRKSCFIDAARKNRNNRTAIQELASRHDRSDEEVRKAFVKTRAKVEASPVTYYQPLLDNLDVSILRSMLKRANSVKSLRDICGSFDYASLPNNNAGLDAAYNRLREYKNCIADLQAGNPELIHPALFKEATDLAAQLESYSCSRKRVAGCVPDANLRRVSDIANPENLAIVSAAKDRIDYRKAEETKTEYQKISDWQDRIDAHIARRNREIEARNQAIRDRQSYANRPAYGRQDSHGSSQYPRRQDSSTSAPGMR